MGDSVSRTDDAAGAARQIPGDSPPAPGEGGRLPLEPMDPRLTDIQPGGGVIIRLEQAWGRIRRAYLKTFRRGYVQRMAALRQGNRNPCPHDVLDPRDLKFHRNQVGWHWRPEDDPFAWRDRIPFARAGLAELLILAGTFFAIAFLAGGLLAAYPLPFWVRILCWLALATGVICGGLIVWFFRDPERRIPSGGGVVVAPADGKIVSITEIDDQEFVGGRAVEVGIFLSIFNVHINRAPMAARVIGLKYREGKYLNALRPESARENEQLAIRLEQNTPPYRRMIVRQITGAIARRIVCWVKPGDELAAGERLGMIKLGSRTELVLPHEPGLRMRIQVGQMVQAGSSIIAEYVADAPETPPSQ